MKLLTPRASKWLDEIPLRIVVVVVSVPLVAAFFGYHYLGSPGVSTTRSFLGTLVTVQGSVLAIVFSVTLVAVQLTASRYSSRFATLYVRSPTFKFTFGVFAASIGLSLILLFNTTLAGTRLYRAGLYGTGGFLLAVAASLYWFVRRLTYLSTPEGLLELFEQDLTTEKYFEEAQRSLAEEKKPHPLRPLHAMASGALQNFEVTTAENAVVKEVELAKHHHHRIVEDSRYDVEDQKLKQELTKPVVKEHLLETVITGADRKEFSLVRTTVRSQVTLAEYGMEVGGEEIVTSVTEALNLESRRTHSSDTVQTLDTIWRQYGTLVEPAVDTGDAEIVRRSTRAFDTQLPGLITSTTKDTHFERTVEESLRSLRRGLVDVLREHGEKINQSGLDWVCSEVDESVSPPSKSAWYLFKYFRRVTVSLLEYQERYEEDFVGPGQVLLHWQKVCESAVTDEGGELASVVCRGMIELVLFYDDGTTRLIHIGEQNPDCLADAFDEILAYEQESPASEEWPFSTYCRDDSYCLSQLGHSRPPLNVREDFPEVVEQRRDEVLEEVERR